MRHAVNTGHIAFLATGAAAAAVLLGSQTAHASTSPSVVGKKYSDAKAALSEAGFSPVVSTTVGAALPWDECVVSNQRDRTVQPPPNSQWNGGVAVSQTLVTLNCNAALASPGTPGNSAASPEGRSAAAAESPSAAEPTG